MKETNKPKSQDSTQEEVEIDKKDWMPFLDDFSRLHEGCPVRIIVKDETGTRVEVKKGKFQGISIDRVTRKAHAYIEVGGEPDNDVTHTVQTPARIRVKRDESRPEEVLEVVDADGSVTLVELRPASRSEKQDESAA
jgi:hypothetical protein